MEWVSEFEYALAMFTLFVICKCDLNDSSLFILETPDSFAFPKIDKTILSALTFRKMAAYMNIFEFKDKNVLNS